MQKIILLLMLAIANISFACHYCSCYPYCRHNHTNVKVYQKRFKLKCYNCNKTFWAYVLHVYCIDRGRYVPVERRPRYCSDCYDLY